MQVFTTTFLCVLQVFTMTLFHILQFFTKYFLLLKIFYQHYIGSIDTMSDDDLIAMISILMLDYGNFKDELCLIFLYP